VNNNLLNFYYYNLSEIEEIEIKINNEKNNNIYKIDNIIENNIENIMNYIKKYKIMGINEEFNDENNKKKQSFIKEEQYLIFLLMILEFYTEKFKNFYYNRIVNLIFPSLKKFFSFSIKYLSFFEQNVENFLMMKLNLTIEDIKIYKKDRKEIKDKNKNINIEKLYEEMNKYKSYKKFFLSRIYKGIFNISKKKIKLKTYEHLNESYFKIFGLEYFFQNNSENLNKFIIQLFNNKKFLSFQLILNEKLTAKIYKKNIKKLFLNNGFWQYLPNNNNFYSYKLVNFITFVNTLFPFISFFCCRAQRPFRGLHFFSHLLY
jgi:hypothetical protein